MEKIIDLKLEDIIQMENSRGTIDDKDLNELMTSMRHTGLLQPIGVSQKGSKMEIVWGNRRLCAAKKLGWKTIPAIMTETKSEDEFLTKNLTENIVRSDLGLIDQGRSFEMLIKKHKLSISEVSSRTGKSEKYIKDAISAFHSIPTEFRSKIVSNVRGKKRQGTISATAANKVVSLIKTKGLSKDGARALLNKAMEPGMTTDKLISSGNLYAQGFDINYALQHGERVVFAGIRVPLLRSEVYKFEKNQGKRISKAMREIIEQHPLFKNIIIRERK